MTDRFVASQVVATAAFVLSMVRFTRKDRKSLLRWALPSGLCNMASMALNGQTQGLAVAFGAIATPMVQSVLPLHGRAARAARLGTGLAFAAMALLLAPPAWGQWLTWLPIAGYLNTRLIVETRTDYIRMRLWWLLSTLCWLAYQMGERNVVMALTEGVIPVIGVRAIVRAKRQAGKTPANTEAA